MLKVTLNNFRSFESKSVELPSNGLFKLSGDSGKGKSSVLEAIAYALYGDDVTKNIRPLGKPKGLCSVEAVIGSLNVRRQKSPELLEVSDSVGNYQNEAAQGHVDNTLSMGYEQFMASSYVKQKMTDSLLTLAPAEMMRFIQKVAFGKEDPEIIKQKINSLIKSTEGVLESNNKNIDFTSSLLTEDVASLLSAVQEYESSKVEYSEADHLETKKALAETEQDISKASKKLSDIKDSKTTLEKQVAESVHHEQRLLEARKALEDVSQSLSVLEEGYKPWPKFSEEDSLKNLEKIKNQQAYFNKLEQISSVIENVKLLGYSMDGNELSKQIKDIELSIGKNNALSIEVAAKIALSEQCSGSMMCPHCEQTVFLMSGKLVKNKPASSLEELVKEQKSIKDTTASMEKSLSKLKEVRAKLTSVNEQMTALGEAPMPAIKDAEHLKSIKEKMDTYYNDSKSTVSAYAIEKERLSKEILEKTNKVNDLTQKQYSSSLQDDLLAAQAAINSISDTLKVMETRKIQLVAKLETLQELKEKDIKQKGLMKTINTITERKNSLENKMAELQKVQENTLEKLENLKRLKLMSDQAVSNSLNSIVSTINVNAKHYLEILFPDQGTTVALSTTKINKDDSVRAKMSVKIIHKGVEYNDVNELSGGEQSRICLAYQLALSDLFNSPVLMLDEAFSGLQTELKEDCIEALRTVALKKLIILTEHGTNDAIFDDVIEI